MPQINYGICNHQLAAIIAPRARALWPKKERQDDIRASHIRAAMNWIQKAVIDSAECWLSCDEAFKTLPGGRTFSEIWSDNDIWISFLWTPDEKQYGEAVRWGRDISVSYGSFRHGWKMVAATIIHELAHINGAPSNTTDAEDMLLHCGMSEFHRKDIIGYLRAIPKNAIRFA